MATRVNSYFTLSSQYRGRILVTDSSNQSANTSSVRFRVYVYKDSGTGYYNLNSGSRSWSVTGVSGTSNASGSSTFDYRNGSQTGSWKIADYTRTISHNTDGSYYDSSFSTSISHVGTPPGSGSRTNSLSLTNYPPPSSTSLSSSNIGVTSATISASVSSNGNGTSTTLYFYYRLSGTSSWTYVGSGSPKNLTGLSAYTTYQWYVRATNNTGNSSNSSVQSFTTLPAPSTSRALFQILGIQ